MLDLLKFLIANNSACTKSLIHFNPDDRLEDTPTYHGKKLNDARCDVTKCVQVDEIEIIVFCFAIFHGVRQCENLKYNIII